MNKKQLIVLGIGVLLICSIILIAPKYVYIPYKGTFPVSEISKYSSYLKGEQKISCLRGCRDSTPWQRVSCLQGCLADSTPLQKISWDWVIQYSLPVILITGFLMLLFKGPVNFPAIRLPKLPEFPGLPMWSLWFILIIVFIVFFIIFSMIVAVIFSAKSSMVPTNEYDLPVKPTAPRIDFSGIPDAK